MYLQAFISKAICKVILRHCRQAEFKLRVPHIFHHFSADKDLFIVWQTIKEIILVIATVH
jgi:hypothetical protein